MYSIQESKKSEYRKPEQTNSHQFNLFTSETNRTTPPDLHVYTLSSLPPIYRLRPDLMTLIAHKEQVISGRKLLELNRRQRGEKAQNRPCLLPTSQCVWQTVA